MPDFSESRNLPIDGFIINIRNLQSIASYIFSEYEKHSGFNNNSRQFSITLEREDGVILKSVSPSILNEGAVTSESRIISVYVQYRDYMIEQSISISLRHQGSIFSLPSHIDVEGKDRSWVNGQISVLAGIIRGFESQNNVVKRFRVLLSLLLGVPIGFGWVDAVMQLFGNSIWNDSGEVNQIFVENPTLRLLVIICTSAIVGFIPSYILLRELQRKLWPSVEIQVGPEHHFSEKRNRRRASWIAFVLIPAIVGLAGLAVAILSFL